MAGTKYPKSEPNTRFRLSCAGQAPSKSTTSLFQPEHHDHARFHRLDLNPCLGFVTSEESSCIMLLTVFKPTKTC